MLLLIPLLDAHFLSFPVLATLILSSPLAYLSVSHLAPDICLNALIPFDTTLQR